MSNPVSVSVVVTALNFAEFVSGALASVAASIQVLHQSEPTVESEIVFVDDGSVDETFELAQRFADSRRDVVLVHRPSQATSNAAASRNAGVARATGDVLAFLDGDDRFLPPHLLRCVQALVDPQVDYVKTGVVLPESVDSTWRDAITYGCLVSNLAVRRELHDIAGGFPDMSVFERDDLGFHHSVDIFAEREDVYYLRTLRALAGGIHVAEATVLHRDRPGNAIDRQRARFAVPPTVAAHVDPRLLARYRMCDLIVAERVRDAKERLGRS